TVSGVGTDFGVEANTALTSTVAADTTFGVNGKVVGVTLAESATSLVSKVNAAGTGVKAESSVTTTISNISATDDGVLSVVGAGGVKDSYNLADYAGDEEALATDLGKAGYDVSYDKDTSVISITAKNVDGIEITGSTIASSTVLLGASGDASAQTSISKVAEISFSSSEKFTLEGASVDDITGIGATGGSSTLNKVSSIDIGTAQGAQDALDVIDAA
ncbi:flagellin, partial [Shewanella sp. SG41-3]|nr:flagellin [Shewanella sp. SG41-3]